MKVITIVIPTYNEEENIDLVYGRVSNVFQAELYEYGYQIMFCLLYTSDAADDNVRV